MIIFSHIIILSLEQMLSLELQIFLPKFFRFSPSLFSTLPLFSQLLFTFKKISTTKVKFLSFDLILTSYNLLYLSKVVLFFLFEKLFWLHMSLAFGEYCYCLFVAEYFEESDYEFLNFCLDFQIKEPYFL